MSDPSPERLWAKTLMELVKTSRGYNQDMRFGQLLFNAFALHDGRQDGYDEDFHRRLFYAEDYDIAQFLKEWFEHVEQWQSKKD